MIQPSPGKLIRGISEPTITLLPDVQNANEGDTVTLDVWVDFSTEPALGGGFDIFYDELKLSYNSFSFDPGYTGDPDFSRPPDEFPGGVLDSLAIGDFFDGITGPELIGTLSFTAIAEGMVDVTMADDDNLAGQFISFESGSPLTVNYIGSTVFIGPGTGLLVSPPSIDFGTVIGLAEQALTVANLDI